MEKVIREGKVAVIISQGHGAGWYSWNSEYPQLLFHPKLVEMIEEGKRNEIDEEWVERHLGIEMYAGGASGLSIEWLPVGTRFMVEEYDGAERILTVDNLMHIA